MAKLMIIDDDRETCEYLKDFFELRKCAVVSALSGDQGLDLIKQDKPDIVLLDIKMPDKDGLAVLRDIKQIDPNIKVIMITVASDDETKTKAKELGADDFVRKPFNMQYLEGTVSLKVSKLSEK